jgi:hypothetical protein
MAFVSWLVALLGSLKWRICAGGRLMARFEGRVDNHPASTSGGAGNKETLGSRHHFDLLIPDRVTQFGNRCAAGESAIL